MTNDGRGAQSGLLLIYQKINQDINCIKLKLSKRNNYSKSKTQIKLDVFKKPNIINSTYITNTHPKERTTDPQGRKISALMDTKLPAM